MGYRHCGFSATEKNLIIICRGWQLGIWLVEIFSAVLNSCCKFSGIGRSLRKSLLDSRSPFLPRRRGKDLEMYHRRVSLFVSLNLLLLLLVSFFSFFFLRGGCKWLGLCVTLPQSHARRFPHLSPG